MKAKILFNITIQKTIDNSSKAKLAYNKPSLFQGSIFTKAQNHSLFKPFTSITEFNTYSSNNTINHQLSSSDLSTHSSYSSDPYSNINIYTKQSSKGFPVSHKHHKPNAFSKQFNAISIKKEIIDKQIIRQFHAFVIDSFRKNPNLFQYSNTIFWNDFCTQRLFPPMKYKECIGNNITIEFKSFNANYYEWLFTKKGARRLFEAFSLEKGDNIVKSVLKYNKRNKAKKEEGEIEETIREYLSQIAYLYSNEMSLYLLERCKEPMCSCNGCNRTIDDLILCGIGSNDDKCECQSNPLNIKHPFFENTIAIMRDSSMNDNRDEHQEQGRINGCSCKDYNNERGFNRDECNMDNNCNEEHCNKDDCIGYCYSEEECNPEDCIEEDCDETGFNYRRICEEGYNESYCSNSNCVSMESNECSCLCNNKNNRVDYRNNNCNRNTGYKYFNANNNIDNNNIDEKCLNNKR